MLYFSALSQPQKIFMTKLNFLTAFILSTLFSTFTIAQPCIDGSAGGYPCDKVDQISMIPLSEFDAANVNDIWGWTSPDTKKEYVLLGFDNKTAFLDITSPAYPIYLGYLPTVSDASLWRDVKVIDNYAYIVSEAENHGLQIFDLRRLENLTAEGSPHVFDENAYYGNFGNAHNIVADTANKFVYGVGTSTFGGGLHAVDVSDPLNPTYAGSNSQGGYVHDAQVLTYTGPDTDHTGKQILIGFNEDRLVIYDVTDKADIEIISETTYEDVGYTHQGWFTEDLKYIISNDETDELDFDINTRTIIWDASDLDNPEVINYVDLENTSVDHNLYIDGDMLYESNYTNGLRIFDLLEVASGQIEPFGFFDVVPSTDQPFFIGTWSNYPYFESGIIPMSGMYSGLHIVKPQYFNLSSSVVRVCDESTGSLPISIQKRIFGTVSYSVEMESVSGLNPVIEVAETNGAPATNEVTWTGLNMLAEGYYSGEVVISFNGNEERLPFVLVKGDELTTNEPPTPVSPNFEVVPYQDVVFTFTDPLPGVVTLEVALDEDFNEIVYQETFYNSVNSVEAIMPFDMSTYFWRLIKPVACGEEVISDVASFVIDISSDVENVSALANFGLFPNPANDLVYISGEISESAVYHVYDVAGKEVDRWNGSGVNGFSISNLEPGLYIVKSNKSRVGVRLLIQ